MKILLTGDVCFREQLEMDAALAKKVLAPIQPVFDAVDFG